MNNETPISSDVTVSIGIEKIKPIITQRVIPYPYCSMAEENRAKINEIIENQNKIIDYLNQQVKK